MLSGQTKTRKGASAIYVVIFTATLLSVIALSFIRLMLSESTRTTSYSLSQSAYNSALAGIEDAKIVLIRYENCIADGNANDCPSEYTTAFGGDLNGLTNSQDCDLVPKLLGYPITEADPDENKSPETSISTGGEDASKVYDQAYTCVKISRMSKDFIATLTENNPTKIVPLRTGSDNKATSVNRLLISWFSRTDLSTVSSGGGIDSNYYSFNVSGSKMSGTIRTNNGFLASNSYGNWFTSKPSVPTTLQTTLIQTAKNFKTSEFYSSSTNGRTNRGTILFRPSKSTTLKANNGVDDSGNYSNHINGNPFVTSATKSQNNPMDVYCNYTNNIEWGNGYACVADVRVPLPKPTTADKRNDKTFFLVLNLPYGKPKTEVSVEMKHCERHDRGVFEPGNCSPVYFDGAQAVVDSTGRANDLFRRVEARVELTDSNFPLANFALAAYDPSQGNVSKSFYVTTANCKSTETIRDTSATEAGSTKNNVTSCQSAYNY